MADPYIWDVARLDGLMYTLFSIAAISTVLRLLTRGHYLRTYGWDDATSVAATIAAAAYTAFSHLKVARNNEYLEAVRDGAPIKEGAFVINLLTESERMLVLKGLFYTITLCLIKCTILIFYRRIVVLKSHRIMIYTTIGLIIAFTIGYIVAKLMSKDPPIAVWHPYDPKYDGKVVCSCAKLAIINSSFQAFFDIIILLIPIPIFKILKPNYNLRVGIAFIYLLGLFSFSTTLMRLGMAIRTYPQFNKTDFVGKRETWTEYSVWEAVEISTALFCANLPPMTTVLRHAFRRIASSVHWPSSLSSSSSPAGLGVASGEKGSSDSNPAYKISKKVSVDIEQGYYVDQSGNEVRDMGGTTNVNGGGGGAAAAAAAAAPTVTATATATQGAPVKTDVAPWENGMLEPQPDSERTNLPMQQTTSRR